MESCEQMGEMKRERIGIYYTTAFGLGFGRLFGLYRLAEFMYSDERHLPYLLLG